LRPDLPKMLSNAYDDARIDAANDTALEIDTFPETREWTAQEVLAEQ
jgi:hypothetical protein